jgi:hypothetical protein
MQQIKQGILAAIFILGLSSCGVATSSLRIMPMGDSITYGSNWTGAYRTKLERQLTDAGISFRFVGSQTNGPAGLSNQDNEGHPGWKVQNLAVNARYWMESYQPDIVLLMIGTNDVAMAHVSQVPDMVQVKSDLRILIDEIFLARPQVRLFLATIPPTNAFWNQYVIEFNAEVRATVSARQMRGQKITLVDAAANLTLPDMDQTEMPVLGHPSSVGYEKIADSWASALLPSLL